VPFPYTSSGPRAGHVPCSIRETERPLANQLLRPDKALVYTSRAVNQGHGVGDVTALIRAAGNGDASALPALFERVYAELKQLARKQLAAASSTLDTTGLVHEAYLKLAAPRGIALQGRRHFFALAAKAMRQIVIDRARAQVTDKRGGANRRPVGLDEARGVADAQLRPDELVRLDDALTHLASEQPWLSELVDLRYFAGLSFADIALLHDTSQRSLSRDWARAKAYLHASLYPET
jgi:RNA polymerase sigma factor (TIGR02999 family)